MSLADVIGHEKAVRILLGTIKRNRVPSSMLMSGDAGIGKAFTALNYIKAINCLSPVNSDSCDNCVSCVKIDKASHPDVLTISPENNEEIKIDVIRQAEESLWLKPFEGKKKILLIDNADRMNISAANAFLKTLEEPPLDSLIILISASPDRLPDTVRSRCMNIRFRPLSSESYRKVISRLSKAKGDLPSSAMTIGRPGMAINRDVEEDKKWFLDTLSALSRVGSKCAWNDKADIKRWLDLCMVWIRDIVVFSETGRESDLLIGERHKTSDIQSVLKASQSIQRMQASVDMNLNKAITWNYVSVIIQEILAGQGKKI